MRDVPAGYGAKSTIVHLGAPRGRPNCCAHSVGVSASSGTTRRAERPDASMRSSLSESLCTWSWRKTRPLMAPVSARVHVVLSHVFPTHGPSSRPRRTFTLPTTPDWAPKVRRPRLSAHLTLSSHCHHCGVAMRKPAAIRSAGSLSYAATNARTSPVK